MGIEDQQLNQPEKNETSGELAKGHISLELKKADEELRHTKVWEAVGAVAGGGTMFAAGNFVLDFIKEKGSDLGQIFEQAQNSPEFGAFSALFISLLVVSGAWLGANVFADSDKFFRRFEEKARNMKNRFLS